MAIASTDLKWYGSAVMPDNDITTSIGGAINLLIKIEFTDITPTGAVEMLSSNGADTTQTVTITGRNAAGEVISETKTLAGGVTVDFTSLWERILKVVMSTTAVGTVTIRKDGAAGDLVTLEPGLTQVRRLFYSPLSEEVGGATRTYYEKIFVKNTHGTLSLTNSVVSEFADPLTFCNFALEVSLNGTDTNGAGNRQTHTGGYTFNSTAKNVVNGQNLTAGAAQGVWMSLTLTAGLAPAKSSVTMRITGDTI
jgi:hypothetical protein